MVRRRSLSSPARVLLAMLLDAQGRWKHGYDLANSTGLKSGTLYPLLIRLEAQGYLEAEWQPPAAAGRPPRHAYRLTSAGERLARAEGIASDAPPSRGGWRNGEVKA